MKLAHAWTGFWLNPLLKFWCAPGPWRPRAETWSTWRLASRIFATPKHVIEAAKRALEEGWTHYGPTQGYPELRGVVAEHVSATRGIRVGPEHVSIVPGGKPIIFFPTAGPAGARR